MAAVKLWPEIYRYISPDLLYLLVVSFSAYSNRQGQQCLPQRNADDYINKENNNDTTICTVCIPFSMSDNLEISQRKEIRTYLQSSLLSAIPVKCVGRSETRHFFSPRMNTNSQFLFDRHISSEMRHANG